MEQDQGRFLPSLNFTFENIIAHVLNKVLQCTTLLCREGKEQFNHVTVILVMLQYVIRNLEIKLDLDLFSRSSLPTCKLQLRCLTLYQP